MTIGGDLRVRCLALAELTLGIITASLPVLSILVTKTVRRFQETTMSQKGRYVFPRGIMNAGPRAMRRDTLLDASLSNTTSETNWDRESGHSRQGKENGTPSTREIEEVASWDHDSEESHQGNGTRVPEKAYAGGREGYV